MPESRIFSHSATTILPEQRGKEKKREWKRGSMMHMGVLSKSAKKSIKL